MEKFKVPTGGCDTPGDICSINGGAIQGICHCGSGGNKISCCVLVIAGDGYGLVEVEAEAFNAECLVVPFGDAVKLSDGI